MTMEQEIYVEVQFNMITRSLGENVRYKSEFEELNAFEQEIRTVFRESIGSHFRLEIWIRGAGGSRKVIASNLDLKDAIYNTRKTKILFYVDRSLQDIGTPEIENRLAGIEAEITGLKNKVGTLSGEVGYLRGDVANLRGEVGYLQGDVGNLRSMVQHHLAMCQATETERASSLQYTHGHGELLPDIETCPLDPTITSRYGGGAPGIKAEEELE